VVASIGAAMKTSRRRSRLRAWTLALALLAAAGPAAAVPVAVSPTLVTITPTQPSQLLSLTNDGDTAARFQLNLFAWEERPSGETVLTPSDELLVFPPLLVMAPHETKRVRVGAPASAAGWAEKSYRLIIQELPEAPSGAPGVQIQVLTKLSLPVFLQGGAVQAAPRLADLTFDGKIASFAVDNPGTGHLLLQRVSVAGRSNGREVFTAAAIGWYILAGGQRRYAVEIAAADCRAGKELVIEAETAEQTIRSTLTIPPAGAATGCLGGAATRFLGLDGQPPPPPMASH
jgi:fimbrial chaperone protein